MTYTLLISRRAQRELEHLPTDVYESVRDAIGQLADDPHPAGSRKLTGRPAWRIRVRDYRVLYEIDDQHRSVTVVHIGHRRDVYRL